MVCVRATTSYPTADYQSRLPQACAAFVQKSGKGPDRVEERASDGIQSRRTYIRRGTQPSAATPASYRSTGHSGRKTWPPFSLANDSLSHVRWVVGRSTAGSRWGSLALSRLVTCANPIARSFKPSQSKHQRFQKPANRPPTGNQAGSSPRSAPESWS